MPWILQTCIKGTIDAGIFANTIALTLIRGARIATEGWPGTVSVTFAVSAAFCLGGWFADRRLSTVVAVVPSFCEDAACH